MQTEKPTASGRMSMENDPTVTAVSNGELVCKTCRFLWPDNTLACEIYRQQKPGSVFYGKPCKSYEPNDAEGGA